MLLLTKPRTKATHKPGHVGAAASIPQRDLLCNGWWPPRGGYRLVHCVLLLFFSLLLTLATACQAVPRPAVPQWLPQWWGAAPTPTPPPITTELHFATWPVSVAVDDYFRQRLAAYQQTQPDTQVELALLPNYATRLRTALEGETPPDVMRINAFLLPDLVAKGLLAPLPTTLVDQADLSPLLRQMGEVAGMAYCIPHDVNTLALLYNRTLFDAAQLAYPTGDWTWETLRTAAEQLSDAEAKRYGLVLPADFSRWLPFLYQAGGAVMDSTTLSMTLATPAASTALQFYSDLVLDGMAAAPTTVGNSWAGEAFAQGHAAMTLEGNWLLPYLAEVAPTLDYGVAPLPAGPVGRATLAFATCYAIAAGSTQVRAAGNLIQFLTTAESQQSWLSLTAALPARSDLVDAWLLTYPAHAPFAQSLATAQPWRFRAGFQPVVDGMNEGLQQIYGGFVLPDAVLAEAEATGNAWLQRQPDQP